MLEVHNVSKLYRLYQRPFDRLAEILPIPRKPVSEFWALRDISLHVDRGEVFALVGPNGSGKSTLLQIVSGILEPTRGRVITKGRIAALLELGAGFNPEFTGRENVFLNGEILGLSRREISAVFPQIEAFADIGAFIDRPVKEYSSGMYLRLTFSTAIHVDPEILIVDEALAVGDAIFANRCVKKFEELKARGVTVLFVSHDLGLVKRLADRAAFLLSGKMVACGSPSEVVNRYVGVVLEREQSAPAESTTAIRHGDGASRVTAFDMLNESRQSSRTFHSGDSVTIRIRAEACRDLDNPIIGVLLRNRLGIDVFGTNTRVEGIDFGSVSSGRTFEAEFTFDCLLTRQDYTLTVATQYSEGYSQDWLDDVLQFSVVDPKEIAGLVNLRPRVTHRS